MHEPCKECVIRRGHAYTKDCDDKCSYASAVKCRDDRIDELEDILKKVMRQVDKWLRADDFDEDEIMRANIMDKRLNELIDSKDRLIRELRKGKD